jgi:[NiFe] hydrogenase diaphorase moiety small subunit
MNNSIEILIDGNEVMAQPEETILIAAERAGIYIPRLCAFKGLSPHGSCRVCSVKVNGRVQAACVQTVARDMVIETNTPEIQDLRKALVEMLFVEGNHICPFCEKSGNCELQAMAYRLGIDAPRFPFIFPERKLDSTHPDVLIDRNRCILCGRCVRASQELDQKHVFDFVGRGAHKCLAVNSPTGLAGTSLASSDKVIEVCPVGALVRKRIGYQVPIGQRLYDHQAIGSKIAQ